MNYNSKYICSYKELDDDDKYREDILNIFHLTEYNDSIIEDHIEELFNKIKDNKIIISCCQHLANKIFSSDLVYGFIFLYSFEYLYLIHKCVCELLEDGFIKSESLELLEKKVFNKE
jgi:hypothetical protein